MDKIIGLKELREHVDTYVAQVQRGKSFMVVRRSEPIFRLTPPDVEAMWETVIDFTKIKKGGVAIEDALSALRRLNG